VRDRLDFPVLDADARTHRGDLRLELFPPGSIATARFR
jgi:hypothetical protein